MGYFKKLFTPKDKQLNHQHFKPVYSYSQDGEDMIIRSLLIDTIPDYSNYKGYYVDIGAHHPYRFSNTMHFYQQGWQGINIEPTPDALLLFNKYRSRDVNLNIGIGDTQDKLTFYCFNEPALNSFDKTLSETRHNEATPYHITQKLEVEVYTLAAVLEKHLPANTGIDFLSIDAEGFDVQILKSNNWNKYLPAYILAEDDDATFADLTASALYTYLHNMDYELVAKTTRTMIFKQKNPLLL